MKKEVRVVQKKVMMTEEEEGWQEEEDGSRKEEEEKRKEKRGEKKENSRPPKSVIWLESDITESEGTRRGGKKDHSSVLVEMLKLLIEEG